MSIASSCLSSNYSSYGHGTAAGYTPFLPERSFSSKPCLTLLIQADYRIPTESPAQSAADNTVPRDAPQYDGANAPDSLSNNQTTGATLEHDPNSGRRKRRKTREPADAGVIENFFGNGASNNDPPSCGSASVEQQTPSADAPGQSQELDNPEQQLATGDTDPKPADPTSSEVPESQPSKRKTLKINPNGKLLSSPAAKQPEEAPHQRPRRGRPKKNEKTTEEGQKSPVVIQYATEQDQKERIGKLIEDIISGRNKPSVSKPPPIPTKKGTHPPKPTHPFFLKPARKIDAPAQADETPMVRPEEGPPHDSPTVRQPSSLSTSSPKRCFPKFPEPIAPLWPPRDFVHVRDVGALTNRHAGRARAQDLAQKKAKMAAIRIGAQENVVSSAHAEAQRSPHQTAKTLRIPGKHVASGRVLQIAVAKQLTEVSRNGTGFKGPKPCHPAVTKLSSTVQTSMTAFDRGEFDTLLWAHKYAPISAAEVLQTNREALMLRDWLKYLMVTTVDTGKSTDQTKAKQEDKKRAKKRKKAEKMDGFVVSSEEEASEMGELSESDEDELAGDVNVSIKRSVIRSGDLDIKTNSGNEKGRMSNAILLSGPTGCGKTASVYAVAKELGFQVFELNPGNRRSSRDIVERVGDMTQNHLVHKQDGRDQQSNVSQRSDGGKQNKMKSFFKAASSELGRKEADQVDSKNVRSQKQSLILLEEADLLFEEDKQFWSGVMTLISQSKRPIVITCNDESLIPTEEISFHAILRYRAPPQDLAVDYLLLLTANEGHMLKRAAIETLYAGYGKDFRRAIMELNFWCQMGVGSDKCGLDWIIDRWSPDSAFDKHGDPLRVLSLNTYQPFMGWFSRDMMLDNTYESEIESYQESHHWWQLNIQDTEDRTENKAELNQPTSHAPESMPKSNLEKLDKLRQMSATVDMRSDLDVLCSRCSIEQNKVRCPMTSRCGN